ncbi:hypothetical protein BR93DRAFT_728260 [Coniochaeta sp. PMI_546]|nr:hypothetical protein BR93DRAFT_728260 [Coniochaeta sp. PMI_546]
MHGTGLPNRTAWCKCNGPLIMLFSGQDDMHVLSTRSLPLPCSRSGTYVSNTISGHHSNCWMLGISAAAKLQPMEDMTKTTGLAGMLHKERIALQVARLRLSRVRVCTLAGQDLDCWPRQMLAGCVAQLTSRETAGSANKLDDRSGGRTHAPPWKQGVCTQ